MKNLSVLALVICITAFTQTAAAQSWSSVRDVDDNYYAMRQRFLDYWKDRKPSPGAGNAVFRRWEWFWQSRILPDGSFPPAGINASEWKAYKAKHPQPDGSGGANWTSLGPDYSASGYNGIGRINCITIDPNNPEVIWVGSPSGGLWKSPDGGDSWATYTDKLGVLGVTSILIDPTNTNIMYIGTGDGYTFDSRSIGVLKSTDGGQTWNPTGLDWNVTTNTIQIRAMAIHPTSPEILLAATSNGIFRSTDAAANWTKITNGDFFDIKFKIGDPTTVFAASNTRLYRSLNTGATFSSTFNIAGSDRIAIAITPANPEVVAAVSSSSNSATFGALKGVYVSTNSGANYTLKSSSPNILSTGPDGTDLTGQGWYDLCIAVSPTNPDIIFVGGVNIWRSLDGGSTWTIITYWNSNGSPPNAARVHADKHFMTWNGTELMLGCDGGVYRALNNGNQWADLSNGLVISQMYRLGVSQSDNKVICGLQDNSTKLRGNSGNWTENIGGDGMECFIHPTNSNIMYGEIQYGEIRRSLNGGGSWTNIHNNVPGQPEGDWVTPFVMDPNVPTTIYVGYTNVYKSTNQGSAWTAISTNLSPVNLKHITVAPSSSNTIYATNGGTLYRTTNGGTQWTTVNGNLPGANGITYISVDPADANVVYVTKGGYTSGQKVFMSTTGGTNWTNITGTLPNLPANCVIVQENSKGVLYLAMDVGVYRRDPQVGDWELFADGLPNVTVTELEIKKNTGKLRAATYGRGLWESDLAPVVIPCATPATLAATDVQPRVATLNWTATNDAVAYNVEWRESNGGTWATLSNLAGVSEKLVYLKPCTDYDYRVQSVCSNGTSVLSNTVSFKTGGCSNYCNSYGEGGTPQPGEWIENVRLGDINHTSGNDWGYNDFTAFSALLIKDSTYQIELTPGFSAASQPENWTLWIDWNKDNDFSDAGEQVFAQAKDGVLSTSFTVPASASLGKTRMRIGMASGSGVGPCVAPYTSGETEDYTVNVQAFTPALSVDPSQVDFVAPGDIKFVSVTTNCNWTILNAPAWLAVKPISGAAGTVSVKLTAAENTAAAIRTATLEVSACDGGLTQNISVEQAAAPPAFSFAPASFDVDDKAGCVEVFITANVPWAASSDAPWIESITPESGMGSDTVVVCYEQNTDTLDRSALLLLLAQGFDSLTVTLHQKAQTIGTHPIAPQPRNAVFCRPNPAAKATVFVIEAVSSERVRLDVYGPDGRLVHRVPHLDVKPGENFVPWQTDGLPAGQYSFQCVFAREIVRGKLVVVR